MNPMTLSTIQFSRHVTPQSIRFGAEPTQAPKPAAAEKSAKKPDMPYAAVDFNQQLRGYINHLDGMDTEQLKKSAQWLVRFNTHLMADKTNQHLKNMSNRDFVTYLAIANFFARAEQAPLLESTLKETMGFWKRRKYQKSLEELGLLVGQSHEYRKQNHQRRKADPTQAALDWDAFVQKRLPQDAPMSFPIRFENPKGKPAS